MDINTIISIASLLLGGGGIGGFLTYRYTRRQAEAESEQAEANATKEVQDIYQQMIDDVKKDRDDQRSYIEELKADRQALRDERDQLRARLETLDAQVRDLQDKMARTGRRIESLTPFLCGRIGCELRIKAPDAQPPQKKNKGGTL